MLEQTSTSLQETEILTRIFSEHDLRTLRTACQCLNSFVSALKRCPRGSVGRASQTAGGSIPRWSTSKPQVVIRRKAMGAGKKKPFVSALKPERTVERAMIEQQLQFMQSRVHQSPHRVRSLWLKAVSAQGYS